MELLFINDDFCSFQMSGFEKMNYEGLEEQIRFYAHGTTAILFNMNAQRTYFDSKVWDNAWEGVTDGKDGKLYYNGQEVVDSTPEPALYTFIRNSRELAKNVPDLFEFRYRCCHKYGVEMWHSMRMNDVHWVPDDTLPQHSRFWVEHPEFRRAAYRKPLSSIWWDQALDFTHPEVCNYTFALIAEYLEHECDGLELDFLRSGPYFLPGGSDAGREIMNSLMRRIRQETVKAAEKFGHPVRLLVRVAPDPAENLSLGLDVAAWAKEGLFDIAAPCAPQPGSTDSAVPVTLWKQLLPENILLVPGIDMGINSGYPGGFLRSCKETDAGMAAAYYYRGADGAYLYNHFYSGCGYVKREEQKIAYSVLGNRERTYAAPRRTPAVRKDSVLPGCYGRTSFFPLAWKSSGVYNEIDAGGGTAGRTGYILIGSQTPMPDLEIKLNTVTCERMDHAIPAEWDLPKLPHFAFFRAPEGVLHDGMNGIDVINRSAEADVELNWIELDVL